MGELSNERPIWKAPEIVLGVRFGEHHLLSYASKLYLTTACFRRDQIQPELNLYYMPSIAMAPFPFQIKKIKRNTSVKGIFIPFLLK